MTRWLERLLSWRRPSPALAQQQAVAQAAQALGWRFEPAHEGASRWQLLPPQTRPGLSLHWGLADRAYLSAPEAEGIAPRGSAPQTEGPAPPPPTMLLLRCPVRVDDGLQCLLMPPGLVESLEAALFNHYTDGRQTRADADTPLEVRWLAVLPRLTASDLPEGYPALAGACSLTPWMRSWHQRWPIDLRWPTGEFSVVLHHQTLSLRLAWPPATATAPSPASSPNGDLSSSLQGALGLMDHLCQGIPVA